MTASHLALLRGINVGGKNMLPMKALAGMFAKAGCEDVRTYIQSGNVIFNTSATAAAKVPDRVAAQIAKQFGFQIPVIVRTIQELGKIAAANPYLAADADIPHDRLVVMFLADRPAAKAIASLDPDRSPPDRFTVQGREIFLHCPNGMAKTKLTNAWLDSKLNTISTGRNWRTVCTLRDLMQA